MSSAAPKHVGKRTWARIRHTCLAWIEGEPSSAAGGIARTVDLSPSGAGLILSSRFDAGAKVVVELLLPGSLRLRASGEVVHVVPSGDQFRVGVRFDAPPALVASSSRETF